MQVHSATVPAVLHSPNEDIILMTASNGAAFYAAMSALKAVRPGIRIIVTGPGNRDEDILRAITTGAKGYVSEEASPEEFKHAIREVHAGSVWVRGVSSQYLSNAPRRPPARYSQDRRQDQRARTRSAAPAGFRLLQPGNRRRVGDRRATVKAHVAQLLRKVGVQNRIALSVHAVTHSLLSTSQ